MISQKKFELERDDVLRSLSEDQFDRFARKWKLPQPAQWAPLAKLAAMHKARLKLPGFAPSERHTSSVWLAENGFSEKVVMVRCSECGNTSGGFTYSNCSTCGRAQ